ncbi:peptide chain release factor 3 [Geodermatophilus sabuli]|uniref:Peptide chain release factor 3 n=1 Tax=Geodermatophilus sabuli TaxID=1564158 RepID=A0A285EIU5_9ACTN|nr:peptide chain release factor 3 [Geodermatophilus sabuli]MBB3083629.1 peptide chain release factor 3 [Geodermatophilus sabuli]SNX99059.1 peptide chain release factor 3 [Geodermatophilus sabuli]
MSTSPMTTVGGRLEADRIVGETARRRTFAVISHPDAGKSTLTEALALHARVIGQAGAVHGKAGRRGTVSDWMDMERDRGISITSAALQFAYRDCVVNLLDTPGHADFSEDTYRVLTAVDAAVMLIDGAKGLEAQTMKLFAVCRHRGIPVVTVVNKWDRPGKAALELMDEVAERTGLTPTPLTWPVGLAGDFRGVLDRRDGSYRRFTRTAGGATVAPEEVLSPAAAAAREGEAWSVAHEEADLLAATAGEHDQELFLSGVTTPVLFASAVSNFGVGQLLDTLVDLAPAPTARPDEAGEPHPVDAPFSAFVFKVQAGMDTGHRDRLAYIRVCSGVFERGMVVTNARTGRPFATKYAQQVFGRDRETIETAYPGDVVGLVNAAALGVGDTLYADRPVTYPPVTTFAPEHFAVARVADTSRYKQFRKGVETLAGEGVVQVLTSERRGDGAPVFAVVGPMQFEVAAHRMEHEFGARIALEPLPYRLARVTDAASAGELSAASGAEVLQRPDGELLALFSDKWSLRVLAQNKPHLTLVPMVAAELG